VNVILTADDYAMTHGVSRSIVELAKARRLSATSVMTNMPLWPTVAQDLRGLRGEISIGLHLNLTLGRPLGPMHVLAPQGRFVELRQLVTKAVTRRLDRAELAAEIGRQLNRFVEVLGVQPDHLDGHQHVHALPMVRDALFDALAVSGFAAKPLLRDPAVARLDTQTFVKSAVVRALTIGFGARARAAGYPVNDSFAGFSRFNRRDNYAAEIELGLANPGRCHIVMCHPGYPDAELAGLDPVVDRRLDEHQALEQFSDLPSRVWHPTRTTVGSPIDWSRVVAP
jgi:predicted glycoside hydrolase/deacetylase ChbG (UPF0249 family)